jgi:hypothetical protein
MACWNPIPTIPNRKLSIRCPTGLLRTIGCVIAIPPHYAQAPEQMTSSLAVLGEINPLSLAEIDLERRTPELMPSG